MLSGWIAEYEIRETLLKKIGLNSYSEYLETNHWKEISKLKRSQNRECEICGDSGKTFIHHQTYARLGREKLTDLQTLCDWCHYSCHTIQPIGYVPSTADKVKKQDIIIFQPPHSHVHEFVTEPDNIFQLIKDFYKSISYLWVKESKMRETPTIKYIMSKIRDYDDDGEMAYLFAEIVNFDLNKIHPSIYGAISKCAFRAEEFADGLLQSTNTIPQPIIDAIAKDSYLSIMFAETWFYRKTNLPKTISVFPKEIIKSIGESKEFSLSFAQWCREYRQEIPDEIAKYLPKDPFKHQSHIYAEILNNNISITCIYCDAYIHYASEATAEEKDENNQGNSDCISLSKLECECGHSFFLGVFTREGYTHIKWIKGTYTDTREYYNEHGSTVIDG